MQVDRGESTESNPEEQLPAGTETVVWGASSPFRCNNASEYPEDCWDEDLDLSPVENRRGNMVDPTIVFSPGDEMPLPVAGDIFRSFSDSMVCLDKDNNPVHSGENAQANAFDRWNAQGASN